MRRALLAAALLVPAADARAAEDPGTTAAPVLLVPLGSRALGMGGAYTAVASDASALHYNPAGLARLNAHELGFSYIGGAGETTLQNAAYAGPTPLSGVSGNGYTSAAASLLMSQSGKIQVNSLNADGSLRASETISAGSDMVLTAGYAERAGMTSLETRDGTWSMDHFVGVSGKLLRSTLAETYHASTFAGDAGYLLHLPEAGWSVGASVLNLGGKLRFREQSDPLPTTGRAGVAWQGGVPGEHSVLAALDGDFIPKEKTWHVNTGMEYFFERAYGGRIGYQFRRGDQGGLTFGAGFRWRGRLLIDYAWAMGDKLANAHRFTFTYRFAGVPPSRRGQQRRPFIESAPERQRFEGLEQRRPVDPTPPARARPVPRERTIGVPGWIY